MEAQLCRRRLLELRQDALEDENAALAVPYCAALAVPVLPALHCDDHQSGRAELSEVVGSEVAGHGSASVPAQEQEHQAGTPHSVRAHTRLPGSASARLHYEPATASCQWHTEHFRHTTVRVAWRLQTVGRGVT